MAVASSTIAAPASLRSDVIGFTSEPVIGIQSESVIVFAGISRTTLRQLKAHIQHHRERKNRTPEKAR